MFEALFRALNDGGVRYIVAGGVAVVLHGHPRYTKDLNLVVDLASQQATAAIEALLSLGLVPSAPLDPLSFADAGARQAWIREKGMTAFSLHHPDDARLAVDLFLEPPSDFDALWSASDEMPLETTTVRVLSLDDLIALKRTAGRPRDMLDLDELEQIKLVEEESATDAHQPSSDFSFGGWEGHADRERRAALETMPAQRLEWLEEAMRFVQVVEARRQAGTLFKERSPDND